VSQDPAQDGPEIPKDAAYGLVRDVLVRQAVQEKRIDDHDKVLAEISDSLKGLLVRVDKWERKAFFALVLILAGTDNGGEILKSAGQFIQ